ncbi:MAG: UDP-N-acetyl-D-galactosamine dehydrogenase [Bacteroidetes bacterium]|nr:UDP-N-acetyl-D-galactosamine dehydrogenase [Bacteroidota bacterium]
MFSIKSNISCLTSNISFMIDKIKNKEAKIAVIGLGYVGLPIALAFAKKVKVIGFDINEERVKMMQNHVDPSQELEATDFENCDIEFTASIEVLRQANFFIVAVPTPIDEHNLPDLKPLLGASRSVGKALKKGDYVVYESTVYPGCTEEDCIPVLEEMSGLKFKTDFKVGYSPERINPGDKEHTITKILKVVSGCDEESLEVIAETYKIIVEPGVYKAASIKVAEAAKIIENTQRDVNIALMNELSIIFSRIGINTYDVLEAAGTKWNFLKFSPGLVGGHCIGVDPYYLTYKAEELGYHARVINSGRYVNDSMGFYVAKQTVKKIIAAKKNISESRVLVMGATFKENVSDIRNSKVADVIKEFKSFGVHVDIVDPYADSAELNHEYGFGLAASVGKGYDAVVVAVNHKDYLTLDEKYYTSILSEGGILVDIKGILKGKIKNLNYWSL